MTHPSYALPKRQREALEFIKVSILAHGYSPTLEEIAAGIGSTKQNVRRLLSALELRGVIIRDKFKHRSIIVKDEV